MTAPGPDASPIRAKAVDKSPAPVIKIVKAARARACVCAYARSGSGNDVPGAFFSCPGQQHKRAAAVVCLTHVGAFTRSG